MNNFRAPAARLVRRLGCHAGQWLARCGAASGLPRLAFLVEKADWSIRWDGTYITQGVNAISPAMAGLVTSPVLLRNRVVHFGSQYMWENWGGHVAGSNRYVTTFFHGKREDGPDAARHVENFMRLLPRLGMCITAASLIEKRLLEWGVPRRKLVRIPIGVDTGLFEYAGDEKRADAKSSLGIPRDRLCIGSFQKDGVGWGEGSEPKFIKGPDIFLEAVARISRHRPVFVLLTGPARGYVKAGLERLEVPYKHVFLKDYLQIVDCYHALDLYLMTSREEGGPKSIMESMATGTPIVATRCGMAEDLVRDGINGALSPEISASAMADRAMQLIEGQDALRAIVARAREDVMACDWTVVANMHWERVYKPLLQEL